VLWPHQVDVIPDINNPEKPYAYILSVFGGEFEVEPTDYASKDNVNQLTGDNDDYKGPDQKLVVWTKDFHYSMDMSGNYILEPQINPILMLPLVEFSIEKDAKFFSNITPSLANFTIDTCLDLSDLSNISRLQGFSQAVITAQKPPENMLVGPNRILFLQQDSLPDAKDPRFEFVSPNANIDSAIELVVKKVELYMIAEGIDPKILNADGTSKSYSSALERLIAMIEKFKASKSDFDLFMQAEQELFKVMVAWSNTLQGVTDGYALMPELNLATIPDTAKLLVSYIIPEDVQTKAERETSVEKRLGLGLMSKKRAIMEIENLDDAGALQYLEEIKQEQQDEINEALINVNNSQEEPGGTDDQP
jgi:hypothetical protein